MRGPFVAPHQARPRSIAVAAFPTTTSVPPLATTSPSVAIA
jgi:hypothetical protein